MLFISMTSSNNSRYIAHVVVPTQKDIEDALLRRKKQELMQMYALEEVEQVQDISHSSIIFEQYMSILYVIINCFVGSYL